MRKWNKIKYIYTCIVLYNVYNTARDVYNAANQKHKNKEKETKSTYR